jgi:hypothetical protein
VSGFESEFHGRVRVRTVPHLAPEAKESVEKLGWSSHGLVITRGGRVVYTASDHRANAYDANVALRQQLGWPMQCE